MSPLVWTHALAAVVALIVGIGLGWLLRGAVKEDIADPEKKVRWYRKLGVSEILGIIVTVVAIAALIGLMVSVSEQRTVAEQQRQVTECQSNYNKLVREAIIDRAKASDLDREVLNLNASSTVAMLNVLLAPQSSAADREKAVEAWRTAQNEITAKLKESNQIRQANPLPEDPGC